jgi:hypothetical protein
VSSRRCLAVASFLRSRELYDRIGRLGNLSMSHEEEPSASTRQLVPEEVRQMLSALARAREARGRAIARLRAATAASKQLREPLFG